MTFDELFKDHNLTPAERASLVDYLAHLRAQATRRVLATPPERIGGPCGLCGQPNAHHGGGQCPAQLTPERVELVAAWNDLPDSIRCHPGLKRLFRAAQVA